MSVVTGESPVSIVSESSSAYVVKTASRYQAVNILTISSILNYQCKASIHPNLNFSKGLIFLREFDLAEEDLPSFKADLKESCGVADIEHASFIKSTRSKAYIVTFRGNKLPYSIYIPGERSDTTINPFINRPMLCRNCWSYGHTTKRCKQEGGTCQKCGTLGHYLTDCPAPVEKCLHCEGEHLAGDKSCRRHVYEQEVLNVVNREKVSIQRAKQILENNLDSKIFKQKTNVNLFPTHFDCKLDPANKRKISPFLLEKCIQQYIGAKPRTIRTKDESTFTVQVCSEKESRAMSTVTDINGYPTVVTVNESTDVQKGLIYLYGYDLQDLDSFK